MNTTNIVSPELAEIIAKGHYVPTKRDCAQAGLTHASYDRNNYYWPNNDGVESPHISFVRPSGGTPRLLALHGESRELVFANRDACMAFLRNHTATAAEPSSTLITPPAPAYVPTIKDCYDAGLRRVKDTPTYAPEEQHPYPQWAVQFDENGKNPFMRGGPNDGEALAFTSHDACILFLQSYGGAE